jgi:hypothetical protein
LFHLAYKVIIQQRTLGETPTLAQKMNVLWNGICLEQTQKPRVGYMQILHLAIGRAVSENGQEGSVSCRDEEGEWKASQKDCTVGSPGGVQTLWAQTWTMWLHTLEGALVWEEKKIPAMHSQSQSCSLNASLLASHGLLLFVGQDWILIGSILKSSHTTSFWKLAKRLNKFTKEVTDVAGK